MKKPPVARPITADYLERVTAHYLERYFTSTIHLRKLLLARVERAARAGLTPREEGIRSVDEELARLLRIGALDDARFTADRCRVLRKRGASQQKIRAHLAQKGITSQNLDFNALASEDDGPADDWAAAQIFARKRKAGPWNPAGRDPDQRKRDLGRLVRAGFSFSIAKRIVFAESVEDLEDPQSA